LYVSRQTGLLPALVILGVALALGACGVKGNLESPKAAAAPETAAEGEPVDPATQKIFTSQSKVVRVGSPKILPDMPPREWAKESKSTKGTNAPGTEQRAKSVTPDKPFILDWLL
jgi:predicted small lipoprotein YifL